MTPKELLYIEDGLGHTKFMQTQSQNAANTLQDGVLKNRAQQLADANKKLFDRFYNLV